MNIGDQTYVSETLSLFREYEQARRPFEQRIAKDRNFRLGNQWSNAEMRILRAKGHAPIVVNRIHPAVETAKALLTSNAPSFRIAPREDSDNQVAQALNGLVQYVWNISDGNACMKTVADDYYVAGLGATIVYPDPASDSGKGDIKFRDEDPMNIYIDPTARSRFLDDAYAVIVSRLYTKEQAKKIYPKYKAKIKEASPAMESGSPSYIEHANQFQATFPEQIRPSLQNDNEYIRGYDRYTKIIKEIYCIYETFSGMEKELYKTEMEAYAQQPAWIVNNEQVFVDEQKLQMYMQSVQEQLMQQAQQQAEQITQQQVAQYQQQGLQVDPNQLMQMNMQQIMPQIQQQMPQVQQSSYAELIQIGMINVTMREVTRIEHGAVLGNTLLFKNILDIEQYPVITFMNIHTRTPYPMSDVHMVTSLQEEINKTRSLILAHSASSGNKLILPKGSDIKDIEQKWGRPNAIIEVDFVDGQMPIVVPPAALPGELYQREQSAKNDIDHQLGLYELMMGNGQAAPTTYSATISIDEFGQRKMRSKLTDIEDGLKRMGEIVIDLAQKFYSQEKIFRIINPNNSMSEYAINKRLYDDYGNVKDVINDISRGKYDVVVVSGSTLPSNRYSQLQLYMDCYKNGIIDRVEVLKKTEVFDIEGVMQRTDEMEQMKSQLEQASEYIKKLEGDLQTRDRETINARKETEMAHFGAQLDKIKYSAEAQTQMLNGKMQNTLEKAKGDIALTVKDLIINNKNTGTPAKASGKNKK